MDFGNCSLSGLVFCPIGGIGLRTDFFNRISPLEILAVRMVRPVVGDQYCLRGQVFAKVSITAPGLC
jgi:hypothetical protein